MNRLAREASPYLLQHADNPVDWMPWGEEAFRRARLEDKPIFLSVGYAACHWCHVMAHESFEDDTTAEILNRDFVSVKVDREERPDVDSVYMDAVVSLTGQGGWPLTAFLTPEGEPFFGGTYFPPERRHGMPSFREVLEEISSAWRQDRSRLRESARRLTDHVASLSSSPPSPGQVDPGLETQAMEALLHPYDWEHGGWGGAPKFPQASVIGLLLRRHQRVGDGMALEMAVHALKAMAAGGIFDHVGGGFHRYAVDHQWTVPHFEKMLYDNALLARAYLEAWQVHGDPVLRHTAEATLEFLRRELQTPGGGFSASLDADSEGEEGRFYVWSIDEIRAAIEESPDFDLVQAAFDLRPGGNFEGRTILRRTQTDAQVAAVLSKPETQVRAGLNRVTHHLLEVRAARVPPSLDDKIITSWNGLALSAWAEAARVLRRPEDLATAQRLADFLLTTVGPPRDLRRSWRSGSAGHPAFLEDFAALGAGLLDLYQVDFDRRWLAACFELTEQILQRFADPGGGFFDTADDHAALVARPKTLQDTPIPSGNALTARLLLRLEALTGEPRLRQAALAPLTAMQSTASRHPTAFAVWLETLAFADGPVPQLALVGQPGTAAFGALASEAHRRFLPRLCIAGGTPIQENDLALLAGKTALEGRATAYLCHDFTCRHPTTSPTELADQLSQVR
ncbi:MAG TPA: thioredoxin domain-containing protein [Anaerolineales bacterium]|nr:thioredoxin domain-containing protein [Anaerolineales bacterium]